jgi:hypothetical protein
MHNLVFFSNCIILVLLILLTGWGLNTQLHNFHPTIKLLYIPSVYTNCVDMSHYDYKGQIPKKIIKMIMLI